MAGKNKRKKEVPSESDGGGDAKKVKKSDRVPSESDGGGDAKKVKQSTESDRVPSESDGGGDAKKVKQSTESDRGVFETFDMLCENMLKVLPVNDDDKVYTKTLTDFSWEEVAFPGMTPEECKILWLKLMSKLIKSITLGDLVRRAQRTKNEVIKRIRKRPLVRRSAREFYIQAKVEKEAREHPQADKKLLRKKVNKRWEALNAKKKRKWLEKASDDVIRHQTEVERYQEVFPDYEPKYTEMVKSEKELLDKLNGRPKKPPSNAFLMYVAETMAKTDNDNNHVRLGEVSAKWTAMADKQKEYRERYIKLNEKYKEDLAKYCEGLPEDSQSRKSIFKELNQPPKKRKPVIRKKTGTRKALQCFSLVKRLEYVAANPEMSLVIINRQIRKDFLKLGDEKKEQYVEAVRNREKQGDSEMGDFESDDSERNTTQELQANNSGPTEVRVTGDSSDDVSEDEHYTKSASERNRVTWNDSVGNKLSLADPVSSSSSDSDSDEENVPTKMPSRIAPTKQMKKVTNTTSDSMPSPTKNSTQGQKKKLKTASDIRSQTPAKKALVHPVSSDSSSRESDSEDVPTKLATPLKAARAVSSPLVKKVKNDTTSSSGDRTQTQAKKKKVPTATLR